MSVIVSFLIFLTHYSNTQDLSGIDGDSRGHHIVLAASIYLAVVCYNLPCRHKAINIHKTLLKWYYSPTYKFHGCL